MGKTDSPKVSIIIPTYNRAGLLKNAIKSVQNQTFHGWELIVVDDGSIDDTKVTVEAMAKNDARIRYVYQENAGQAVARNKGIAVARGELLAFLDSDDVYLPWNLERKIGYLNANPDVLMVNGPSWIMEYETGKFVDCTAYAPTSWVARRKYLDAAGGFLPAQRNVEDMGVRIRAANAFENPAIEYMMPEPLTVYFLHKEQVTNTPNKKPEIFVKRVETILNDLDPECPRVYGAFAPDIFSRLANFYILSGDTDKGRELFRKSIRMRKSIFAITLLIFSYGGRRLYGNIERISRSFQKNIIWHRRVMKCRKNYMESWSAAERISVNPQ